MPIKSTENTEYIDITNTSLGVTFILRKSAMEELWNKVKERVQTSIIDEFSMECKNDNISNKFCIKFSTKSSSESVNFNATGID